MTLYARKVARKIVALSEYCADLPGLLASASLLGPDRHHGTIQNRPDAVEGWKNASKEEVYSNQNLIREEQQQPPLKKKRNKSRRKEEKVNKKGRKCRQEQVKNQRERKERTKENSSQQERDEEEQERAKKSGVDKQYGYLSERWQD